MFVPILPNPATSNTACLKSSSVEGENFRCKPYPLPIGIMGKLTRNPLPDYSSNLNCDKVHSVCHVVFGALPSSTFFVFFFLHKVGSVLMVLSL